MKLKAIIFDFDGVLFDSEIFHLQACNDVFQQFGFTIPEEEYFRDYVGLSDNEMFPLILDIKNIAYQKDQLAKMIEIKIACYKDIIKGNKTLYGMANVERFLSYYSGKLTIGICSGSSREEIDIALEKLDDGKLKQYFKSIVTIDDVKSGKPSPEGYLLAAQLLSIEPVNCLVIEDTLKGATAAKAAGMKVAILTTAYNNAKFENVDFVGRDYDEIKGWVERLGRRVGSARRRPGPTQRISQDHCLITQSRV